MGYDYSGIRMSIYGIADDHRKGLQEKIRQTEKDLGSGKAKSFEDYRRLTGKIEGIQASLTHFNETLRSYMREEEDE